VKPSPLEQASVEHARKGRKARANEIKGFEVFIAPGSAGRGRIDHRDRRISPGPAPLRHDAVRLAGAPGFDPWDPAALVVTTIASMMPRTLSRGALRALTSLAALLAVLPLAACADDEATAIDAAGGSGGTGGSGGASGGSAGASGSASAIVGVGESVVRLDGDSISLVRGGETLLTLARDGIQLGVVDELVESFNYDPYPLYVKSGLFHEPEGLAWRSLSAIEVAPGTTTPLTLQLTFDGGRRGALTLEEKGPGSFKALFKPSDAGGAGAGGVAYIRLRAHASADEGFYGLGEYFDDVQHRGKVRAMQLESDSQLESSYNEAHVPVPLVIGTRAWGLFVESPLPMAFSLGNTEADVVEITVGTGLLSADGVPFHLFADRHPLDITRHYYDATAYPRLPARWALGPWIWRDENKDQAEVEDDIDKLRTLDLATSGLWIDRPYATAVNTFDFEPARFPDPKAMIDKLHAYGLRTALWHTPYLDEKDPATASTAKELAQKGYYPPQVGISFNKWGKPIDLTNPDAYAYWQGQIRKYTDMGVEGFKLDYGEDVVPGIGDIRTNWRFFDGSDERTMHSLYQLFYHRVYSETLPEAGGFLICRHGTFGDQANVSVIWPGDLDATFALHREPSVDGSGGKYNAVGGLPASIIAGLSLGPSGFPFYGADTGGYRHSPPDKELFVRWFEQTALSTVMQVGTSSNTVAWEKAGGPGFDDELLDLYRLYTRLHLRLFAYEWTYAQRLAQDGRPIARPLGLAYPELKAHPNDTYMFGDDLLVAPVVVRDQRARDVLFPPGKWASWWTGEIFDGGVGGATVNVKAELGVLPLFVREGGVVPLLRPTIDTMSPTTVPDQVDSYATSPGVLWARVLPGAKGAFSLFDGAEVGQAREGSETRLSYKDGAEFKLGAVIEVLAAGKKPSAATDNGAALAERASVAELEGSASGFAFDAALGSVFVKVGPGTHAVVLTD
jgi:alpha-D-xyloside xylohydrolase